MNENTFNCPVCGDEMIWDSEEEADDSGYTLSGIVSFYHCANCGVMVEILVPYEKESEENDP